MVVRQVADFVFVFNETLGSFLNFTALHPRIQMLGVHPVLDHLYGEVVLRLLKRPRIHELPPHFILLLFVLLGVIPLSELCEGCVGVFILFLAYLLMLLVQLVNDRVDFHGRWVDHGHHVSRILYPMPVMVILFRSLADDSRTPIIDIVFWVLFLRGVKQGVNFRVLVTLPIQEFELNFFHLFLGFIPLGELFVQRGFRTRLDLFLKPASVVAMKSLLDLLSLLHVLRQRVGHIVNV